MNPPLMKFSGMRANAMSVLRNQLNNKMLKFMRSEIARNLVELGQRYYSGDIAAVDEFLQLFCICEPERSALVAKMKAVPSAPTCPGWYWWREGKNYAWTMVQVCFEIDGESVETEPGRITTKLTLRVINASHATTDGEFVGPIPPPQNMETL